MPNDLNLEFRNDIDPSGNGEVSVQVIYVDPATGAAVTSGTFIISHGRNPDKMRIYRRSGDAGSAEHFEQDVNGQTDVLSAA